MYKVVIIDDEKNIQNSLKYIIEEFSEGVEVSGIAYNVLTGVEIINKLEPDIVFLDIEMPDGTGFDLLKKIPNPKFSLIFCTGHDGFAIEAFKYNAIDYVLKPFDIETVVSAIEKAKVNVKDKQKDTAIEHLISYYQNEDIRKKKIVLRTVSDIFIVEIKDIYNCESDKGYTTFKFEDEKKITVSKSLKEYEELLKKHNFIKTHQSHLVNMDYVERYRKKGGGYVVLKNGREVPISIRKKESFLAALDRMHT